MPLHENTTLPERPLLGEREIARRRHVQAAAWRALELARAVFGPGVSLRLRPAAGREGFGGLLHLDVPFDDLPDHRLRENVFTACAGIDPLLSRIHLVYVFNPVPAAARATAPAETR